MQRDEYIKRLSSHLLDNNLSVYDYYLDLAKRIRLAENSNFSDWEINCPFLTGEDYTKLLFSKDPEIINYFAAAMEKVYNFNQVTALVPVENKLVPIPVKEDETIKDESVSVDEEVIKNREGLTRSDLENAVNESMENIPEEKEGLTRSDLENAVNESMENISEEKEGLTRSDLEAAVNESMESIPEEKDGLTRSDLEAAVNESMESIPEENGVISREDITEVINDKFSELESDLVQISEEDELLSREDVEEIVNESTSKLGKLGVLLTTISDKISSLLNGFAVVREKEEKKADLYYHDATTGTLKDKTTIENSNLESGYYVNYQEYVDNMLDSILEQYPTATKIEFINEDENVVSLNQLLDAVYVVLHEAGAIRFGDELKNAKLDTYKDLKELNANGTATFNGNELRKGMFVRRDMIKKVFSKYKAKVTLDNTKEEENTIGKSK